MSKIDLDKALRFQELLHQFALVERVSHIKGRENRENDLEHSYIIPMMAWYVVDAFNIPLDVSKVIKYGLIHDLVEVYAGDTYIFDEEAKKTKHEREEKARLRIAAEFPEFSELNELIENYESQADAESRFVKALDKIEPPLANYTSKGRTWKEMQVSFTELFDNKRPKVAHVEEIRELLEDLVARIEPAKQDYFDKEN